VKRVSSLSVGATVPRKAEILNQTGQLGEITQGAIADVLLVQGNPLQHIDCLIGQGEQGSKIRAIVKEGCIVKNTL